MLGFLTSGGASAAANTVATALANVDMTGVLDELIALLPLVLPVVIAFIGVRKGISFVIGSLRRA